MEFLSISRRSSSYRNVLSGEEQGETAVFAGYSNVLFVLCYSLTTLATPINSALNPTIIGFERSMTGRKRRRFLLSYMIWFSNRRSWVSFPVLYSVKHKDQNINKHFCLVVRNVNWIKCWVFLEYTKNLYWRLPKNCSLRNILCIWDVTEYTFYKLLNEAEYDVKNYVDQGECYGWGG